MPARLLPMRGKGCKVCSWTKGWDATPRARAGSRGVRMDMDAWSSRSDRLAAQGMDVWVSDGETACLNALQRRSLAVCIRCIGNDSAC